MSGFPPAFDSSGNLIFATGNGSVLINPGAPSNWSQSVLKMSPDLSQVLDSFTAGNNVALNQRNLDLGSGGVMLIPPSTGQTSPPVAVVMGKNPLIYLLNQNSLGGYTPTDTGALQSLVDGAVPSGLGLYGGPALYDGPSGPMIYYQVSGAVLNGFSLSTGSTPSLALSIQGTNKGSSTGSIPVVSSNGSGAAAGDTGIVWLVHRSSPLTLEAYDALTLGKPLFRAVAGQWSATGHGRFITPMVANGRVYVGAVGTVTVWGLLH